GWSSTYSSGRSAGTAVPPSRGGGCHECVLASVLWRAGRVARDPADRQSADRRIEPQAHDGAQDRGHRVAGQGDGRRARKPASTMRDLEQRPDSIGEAVMRILSRWDNFDPSVLQDRDPQEYRHYVLLEQSIEELRDLVAQIIDSAEPRSW